MPHTSNIAIHGTLTIAHVLHDSVIQISSNECVKCLVTLIFATIGFFHKGT